MPSQNVFFRDLGKMEYQAAWDYQEELLAKNVEIKTQKRRNESEGEVLTAIEPDTTHHLLFVEHPPVYTLGKSGKIENVLISEQERKEKELAFFRINRGGDITFHGPGQIVAYPIFDLEKFYTDIGRYMRDLEEVIIRTLGDYGLRADRSPGETGVWLDPGIKGKERKICAIGIRCSRWITMHGLAFNVNTNLDYFNNIIPCGIQNKQVTSLNRELSREMNMIEVKEKVKKYFGEVFNVEIV
ncbi:MAG: lipoyl(octanoyl) transferase LipB [Chitinophagaceae bacterium]|nr:lipoyl(octanoyl) transferase LipB [Chitinophagaceae bacterium]